MTKSLREEMPGVSDFIDQMRAFLGKEFVDDQIRRAMQGEPTFYASENGHTIGTRTSKGSDYVVASDDQGLSFAVAVASDTPIWEEVAKMAAHRRSQPCTLGLPISRHYDDDASRP